MQYGQYVTFLTGIVDGCSRVFNIVLCGRGAVAVSSRSYLGVKGGLSAVAILPLAVRALFDL